MQTALSPVCPEWLQWALGAAAGKPVHHPSAGAVSGWVGKGWAQGVGTRAFSEGLSPYFLPLQEAYDDFSKYIEMVEATVELELNDSREYVIKPSFDDALVGKV